MGEGRKMLTVELRYRWEPVEDETAPCTVFAGMRLHDHKPEPVVNIAEGLPEVGIDLYTEMRLDSAREPDERQVIAWALEVFGRSWAKKMEREGREQTVEEKVMQGATTSPPGPWPGTSPQGEAKRTEVLWIHTCGEYPVGIVKAWDPIEERWKFYIGTGMGFDIDEDVQRIIETGNKYYSLDFILRFAGKGE